jgi:menaquinol-cytochrome c reductase iron-sulfur subunit
MTMNKRPVTPPDRLEEPPRGDFPGHPFEIQPAETTRRSLLTKISLVFGSLAAAVVAVPSIAFLLGLRKAPRVWRSVGRISEFRPGTTTKVAFADPSPLPWSGVTAQTAAWLRHEAPGQFAAYSVDCTHLGCPIRWLPDAELFMCPCHGGVFYKDGRVASGPPGRSLVQYPLRLRNGDVEILTSPLPIVG